jgi:hypothetical protein
MVFIRCSRTLSVNHSILSPPLASPPLATCHVTSPQVHVSGTHPQPPLQLRERHLEPGAGAHGVRHGAVPLPRAQQLHRGGADHPGRRPPRTAQGLLAGLRRLPQAVPAQGPRPAPACRGAAGLSLAAVLRRHVSGYCHRKCVQLDSADNRRCLT